MRWPLTQQSFSGPQLLARNTFPGNGPSSNRQIERRTIGALRARMGSEERG